MDEIGDDSVAVEGIVERFRSGHGTQTTDLLHFVGKVSSVQIVDPLYCHVGYFSRSLR